jgi:hypothetical protein
MRGSAACDVSVIVPFADDEDCVGTLVRRIAGHLDALGARHEILAVDEGSGDNSVALLRLVREEIAPLRMLAAAPGAGYEGGARVARGRVLLLWEPARAGAPVGPLAWARGRVDSGDADLVILPGRYTVCRRARAWRALASVRGRGVAYERRLARWASIHGLRVDSPSAPSPAPVWMPLARLLLRSRA